MLKKIKLDRFSNGMKKIIALALIALLVFPAILSAKEIKLTTYYPAPYGEYSQLQASKSFIPPRMTTAERDAITATSTPPLAQGMVIFNTTANKLEVYDGTAWSSAIGGSSVHFKVSQTASITYEPGWGWCDANWDQVLANDGNGFNGTNTFTAPVSGFYLFSINLQPSGYLGQRVLVNGVVAAEFTGMDQSNTLVWKLNAGDKVNLQVMAQAGTDFVTIAGGATKSFFEGLLVKE
jgi:hypothetical protein